MRLPIFLDLSLIVARSAGNRKIQCQSLLLHLVLKFYHIPELLTSMMSTDDISFIRITNKASRKELNEVSS